jgi:hypothetical protein
MGTGIVRDFCIYLIDDDMEKNDFFQEDDQAPLLDFLPKWLTGESSHNGKLLMSHEFKFIDLSMDKKVINEKNIYPAVYMNLMKSSAYPEKDILTLDTYLRKKHRGKYYLWRFNRQREIDSKDGIREHDIICEIQQFHSEIYRVMILGKIVPKSIHPLVFDRSVFELDPDQRSEEERLLEGIKW